MTSIALLALSAVAVLQPVGHEGPRPLAPADVAALHRELLPARDEPWQTIGWRVDLLAARDEAIRAKRPLFLWAMNGHPLGCV